MKKILCMIVGVALTAGLYGKSFSFDEVALGDISTVAVGHIDLYDRPAAGTALHEVWLYTEADCNSIRWTLGEQSHSEPLSCGETSSFIQVPSAALVESR